MRKRLASPPRLFCDKVHSQDIFTEVVDLFQHHLMVRVFLIMLHALCFHCLLTTVLLTTYLKMARDSMVVVSRIHPHMKPAGVHSVALCFGLSVQLFSARFFFYMFYG